MSIIDLIVRKKVENNFFAGEYDNIITLDGVETKIQFSNILFSDLRMVLPLEQAYEEIHSLIKQEVKALYDGVTDKEIDFVLKKANIELLPEQTMQKLREIVYISDKI